jgi:hypothetical protein
MGNGFARENNPPDFLALFPGKFARRPDEIFVTELFRRADSILEAASVPGASSIGTAIVMDRKGGMRILNSDGWTLNGIIGELGAAEVYMIRYGAEAITVEAWSTTDRCTVSRTPAQPPMFHTRELPRAQGGYAAMLQVTPRLFSELKERSPKVWNS